MRPLPSSRFVRMVEQFRCLLSRGPGVGSPGAPRLPGQRARAHLLKCLIQPCAALAVFPARRKATVRSVRAIAHRHCGPGPVEPSMAHRISSAHEGLAPERGGGERPTVWLDSQRIRCLFQIPRGPIDHAVASCFGVIGRAPSSRSTAPRSPLHGSAASQL